MAKSQQYWVFHGVAILPPQPMTARRVNVTISGYGKNQDEAQKDAEKRLQERYDDKRVCLTGIAHVSGPWPALKSTDQSTKGHAVH